MMEVLRPMVRAAVPWGRGRAWTAVIVVVTTFIVIQQAGNSHAQHAAGHTANDCTLGAAQLVTDHRATGGAHYRADHVIGHGGSAAQAQGKYQGGKNTHFINSLKRGAILRIG